MDRQPGDGRPQQHLAHLAALPLVALGSLEPLGIPLLGDAPQGRAVEQRVARFADRGGLLGHDGVAVVAESPLHPRLSVLGALGVGCLLPHRLLLDLVLGDGALHTGEHAPARRGQVNVAADVGQLDTVALGEVDEVLQLAGLAVQPVHVPDGDAFDHAVGDVAAQVFVGGPPAGGGADVAVEVFDRRVPALGGAQLVQAFALVGDGHLGEVAVEGLAQVVGVSHRGILRRCRCRRAVDGPRQPPSPVQKVFSRWWH